MPVKFNKQAFTLQEKIDKAMQLTYSLHNVSDAEFMRAFLLELIEKAFKKVLSERHNTEDANPVYPSELNIANQIENYKRLQQ